MGYMVILTQALLQRTTRLQQHFPVSGYELLLEERVFTQDQQK